MTEGVAVRLFGIALPLVPLAVGDSFPRRAWPAHVTVVGNLSAPGDPLDLIADVLRRGAARLGALRATVAGEAWFGPDRDVLVDLVDGPGLHRAHRLLLDALETEVPGVLLELPHRARDGYRPHRTVVAGSRPAPGDPLSMDALTLAGLDGPDAVVLAAFPLGGPAAAPAFDASAARRVLDALDHAGARAWVVGGWGVDALAGRSTRAHHDLDLLVDAGPLERATAALARLGYAVRSVWSEHRWIEGDGRPMASAFVAADPDGREVDVHVVRLDGGVVLPLSASTVALPPGGLDGVGVIGGRPVRCATAAAQLVMHTGYDLPERQHADVALLRALTAS